MRSITNLNFGKLTVVLLSLYFYRKFGGQIPVPALGFLIFSTLFALLSSGGRILKVSRFDILILVFTVNLIVGLLYSDFFSYGFEKVYAISITVFAFFVTREMLVRNFTLFLYSSLLLFILYLSELYFIYGSLGEIANLLGQPFRLGWTESSESLRADPISISRYAALTLLFSVFIYEFPYTNNGKKSIVLLGIALVATFLAIIAIFLSGTKSPILSFIISVILIYLPNVSSKVGVIRLRSMLIGAMIFVGSLVVINFFSSFGDGATSFIENRYLDLSGAVADRQFQLARAFSQFEQINILFGTGAGDYGYIVTGQFLRDYPHNIFAEVYFEFGLVAFIILIGMFMNAIYCSWRSKDRLARFLSILIVFFFVTGMFSGDLITNSLIFGLSTLLNRKLYR